ncbi:hypothetical protein [Nitrosopumilus sp.]|uniref:hypothetical protein n=1 Tax=Nitrosopumilus sp. TaxID=2024843 RepID=UPI00260187A2|nr:hypothetical protein [Nitrosopumilus sp.]
MRKLGISLFSIMILFSMPLAFSEDKTVELEETFSMTTGEKNKAPAEEKTVELTEELSMKSEDTEPEQEDIMNLAPHKQIKQGVAPTEIQCKESMELVFKISGEPACVKSSSVEKLTQRGWIQ